jgi:peptidoglycan-N-acetylglucosamine deacetylase
MYKPTLIMDADPGGYFTNSALFKTSLLTISFSAFYFYRTERNLHFFTQPLVKTDTATAVVLPVVVARKKKTIYLTFDDGPNKGTKKLMNIVNAEKIPVTVFLVGEHVDGSREQRDIYDSLLQNEYFEIANHSNTHAFKNHYRSFYDQPDSVVKDFERCAEKLDLKNNIVRMPGRNIWRTDSISSTDIKTTEISADSLKNKGFKAIGWDLEWHFTNDQHLVQSDSQLLKQIDSIFGNNKTKTMNQLVLLAHDRTFLSSPDSSALHRLLIALKSRDEYNFETVSKYPGLLK